MTLGIDASRANRAQKTGVEWYAWHLIQELKNIIPPDQEVVLYSSEPLTGELAELPANWRSRVLAWPPKFLWTHFRLSWEMIWRAPDALFVPAHVAPIISPRRLAVTIHDVAFRATPEAYSPQGKLYLNFFNWLDSRRARQIFTVSLYSRGDILKFYPAAKGKVAVVPLAYDSARYRPITDRAKIEAVLAKYGIKEPFILSISRLELKKNTPGMIRAFNLLQPLDYQLVLAGKPGRWYNQVAVELEQSPACDKIILPGWVADENLPYLLAAAKMFLLPSFYEGFGIPILEAMACGCPVITSSVTACPEVAGGAAALVDPAKPEAIAAEILKLFNDESARQELIKRGLVRAAEFSWQQTAQKTWEVLKTL